MGSFTNEVSIIGDNMSRRDGLEADSSHSDPDNFDVHDFDVVDDIDVVDDFDGLDPKKVNL